MAPIGAPRLAMTTGVRILPYYLEPKDSSTKAMAELNKRCRDWRVATDPRPKCPAVSRLSKQLTRANTQSKEEQDKQFRYQSSCPAMSKESLGSGEYHVGIASLRGRRPTMEDAHCVVEFEIMIQERRYPIQLYGVFDGHGGQDVASCVAAYFPNYLKQELERQNKNGLSDQGILNALELSMVRLNNDLPTLSPSGEAKDRGECIGTRAQNQGTCASIAMVLDGKLWTANIGDSRIVIDNNGSPIQMTEDAKPSDARYKKQVEKRGGFVFGSRVNGMLAVPRAIGDHTLNGLICSRPTITMKPLSELDPTHQIILCCDGVFDVASTRQVVRAAHQEKIRCSADELAAHIVYSAFQSDSMDNLSCIVVRHMPKEAASAVGAASPSTLASQRPALWAVPGAIQAIAVDPASVAAAAAAVFPPAPSVAPAAGQSWSQAVAAAPVATAASLFPSHGTPLPPPKMPMVFPPAPPPVVASVAGPVPPVAAPIPAAALPSPTTGEDTPLMRALRKHPRYAQGLLALDEAVALGKQAQEVTAEAATILAEIAAHRETFESQVKDYSDMEQLLRSELPAVNRDKLSATMEQCKIAMQHEVDVITERSLKADELADEANHFKVSAECKKFAAKQFLEDMLADIACGALPHPGAELLAALTAQITNL